VSPFQPRGYRSARQQAFTIRSFIPASLNKVLKTMRAVTPWNAFPLTALMAMLAMAAYWIPALTSLLSIDLANPQRMQLHQLLGCHLLHWSAEHLFWDLAMFCILGGCCERWWPKQYYITVAISAMIIPLLIMAFQPNISSYRGLSGIDTAIFSLTATNVCIASLGRSEWSQAVLFGTLLMSLAGKVAYEFVTGDLLFVSELNFEPLPLAHLIGGIVGVVIPIGFFRLRIRKGSCVHGRVVQKCCHTEMAGKSGSVAAGG
jgi:rhomboid family GlyGly-CTERM serine protease